MKFLKSVLIVTLLCLLNECYGYRILGVFPFNGKSHQVMFEALVKGLAKKGHQVDVITHFPIENAPKNCKVVVDLKGTMESLTNNYTIEFVSSFSKKIVPIVGGLYGNRLCHLMGLEKMQNFIKNPPAEPYDVVLVEAFGANCFMGFGHVFKAPVIAVTTAVDHSWMNYMIGNCDNFAFAPSTFEVANKNMNFWDRLYNIYSYYSELWEFHELTEDSQTESMRKYLSPDIPSIREVEKSIAMMLINSHPILFGVKPLTPGLVQIPGLHIEEGTEILPPDLQKWMDESTSGVVYFTLGSMVIIETLPVEQLKGIYKAFEKIAPVRVLLKVVDDKNLPPGLPKNIRTSPWIPQKAVLSHPNTKIFITHGGLMGVQEAIHYAVPMIGIPLFADQFHNVVVGTKNKIAVEIGLSDLSEKTLSAALNAILHDESYRSNVNRLSAIFKDKPMPAIDTANFWIEYVIRNGPGVLRSPCLDLKWWEKEMLDVFGFVLLVLLTVAIIPIYLIILTLRMFKKPKTAANKKEKRN